MLVGAVLDVASATASMISSAFTLLTAPTPVSKPSAVDEQPTAQTPNHAITVPNAHGGEVVTPSVPRPNPARKLCLDSDGGDSDNTDVPATLDDTTPSRPQTRSKKVEETPGPSPAHDHTRKKESAGEARRVLRFDKETVVKDAGVAACRFEKDTPIEDHSPHKPPDYDPKSAEGHPVTWHPADVRVFSGPVFSDGGPTVDDVHQGR